MTTTQTIAEFVAKHAVSMFVEATDSVPNRDMDDDWNRTASHWRCTLRNGNRRMTVYFSQGSAHVNPPTIDDVLNAVASDSRDADNARDFADWCGDFGYDTDSIKALKTFRACRRYANKLKALLGPVAYDELLACESL